MTHPRIRIYLSRIPLLALLVGLCTLSACGEDAPGSGASDATDTTDTADTADTADPTDVADAGDAIHADGTSDTEDIAERDAATLDTTPPNITSTVPASGATNVEIDRSVVAMFSEPMLGTTLTDTTFTLSLDEANIAGTVTSARTLATFRPAAPLAPNTAYVASIAGTVTDVAGNALGVGKSWTFTTGAGADLSAPAVLFVSPRDGATDVALNRLVTATFSEPMNPATLTGSAFTVEGPGATRVDGALSFTATQATFSPLENLAIDTLYAVEITTDVTDLAGNPMALAETWTFTTGSTIAAGPAPVLLGLAQDYVLLAKSGIDTVPTSAVTGNIGVSPIDSTAITGFSLALDPTTQFATSIQVVGSVRAADYTAPTPAGLTTAISDMETAYVDASGRATPDFTELGAGEIGGLVLSPGLYKWGTGVSIASDVTLDGGPNDVWIFQIAGDITQASATRVILQGGALAENVFWQTFGQTMIGTTAHFEGVVLCMTAIILETGASVNGRLLAQTAITLDANAVTQPAR